jgi:hypothetical protein
MGLILTGRRESIMKFDIIVKGGDIGRLVEKHLPKILMGLGICSSAAAMISVAKSTRKLDGVLVEAKEKLEEVEETPISDEYTESDKVKHIRSIKIRTFYEIVKLYSGALALEVISIGCLKGSHDILNKRYLASSAAAAALFKENKELEESIKNRFGDEVAKELKYKIEEKEVEEEVVDKNGRRKVVKRKEKVSVHDGDRTGFIRFYDQTSCYYEGVPETDKAYLISREEFANNELYRRYFYGHKGYMTVNEVYEMLGFEATESGALAGWVFNPNDPDCMKKKHISFGIFDIERQSNREFVNGIEKVCVLDFNIDTMNVFGDGNGS